MAQVNDGHCQCGEAMPGGNVGGWPICKLPAAPRCAHSFVWTLYEQDDQFEADRAIALKHAQLEQQRAKSIREGSKNSPPWTEQEKQRMREMRTRTVFNDTMPRALAAAGLVLAVAERQQKENGNG